MQPQKPTPPQPSAAKPRPVTPSKAPQPAPGPDAPAAGAQRDSRKLMAVLGAVGVTVLASGLTMWAVGGDAPRLNEDTVSIIKFVNTRAYAKLPFEKQAEYMKVLEDRDDNDELEAAFDAGKLTEGEYRAALLEAWLGQQVKRSEKYASLPPGPARVRYVAELLDKKDAKKARKANKRRPENEPPEVKRDKAQEDIRIAAWPDEPRLRWEQYRRAYDAQREAREAAATQAAEPRANAAGV